MTNPLPETSLAEKAILGAAGCKSDGILDSIDEIIRERDEAREAFVIATDQMVQAQCKTRKSLRERDEARGERDALRDAVNALHDYVHGKRNDDKDISEILNGAMKI